MTNNSGKLRGEALADEDQDKSQPANITLTMAQWTWVDKAAKKIGLKRSQGFRMMVAKFMNDEAEKKSKKSKRVKPIKLIVPPF